MIKKGEIEVYASHLKSLFPLGIKFLGDAPHWGKKEGSSKTGIESWVCFVRRCYLYHGKSAWELQSAA